MFEERIVNAKRGIPMKQVAFQNNQIETFFPEGIHFVHEKENKEDIQRKINEMAGKENLVSVYVEAIDHDLNVLILGSSTSALVINIAFVKDIKYFKKCIQDLLLDSKYRKIIYNLRYLELVLCKWMNQDRLFMNNYYEICHPNNFARIKHGVS